jgi:NAD(P)-dependent dehydrogenase (short-subunit alcohol dehydrogenase family)
MSSYLGLEGKRALVTGGTKGVGQAVVVALREAGATVLTTARSRPESLSVALFSIPAPALTSHLRHGAISEPLLVGRAGVSLYLAQRLVARHRHQFMTSAIRLCAVKDPNGHLLSFGQPAG